MANATNGSAASRAAAEDLSIGDHTAASGRRASKEPVTEHSGEVSATTALPSSGATESLADPEGGGPATEPTRAGSAGPEAAGKAGGAQPGPTPGCGSRPHLGGPPPRRLPPRTRRPAEPGRRRASRVAGGRRLSPRLRRLAGRREIRRPRRLIGRRLSPRTRRLAGRRRNWLSRRPSGRRRRNRSRRKTLPLGRRLREMKERCRQTGTRGTRVPAKMMLLWLGLQARLRRLRPQHRLPRVGLLRRVARLRARPRRPPVGSQAGPHRVGLLPRPHRLGPVPRPFRLRA